jgi:hypothetical protein
MTRKRLPDNPQSARNISLGEQTFSTAAGQLTPYQIYSKAAEQTTKNMVFAGAAAGVTLLVKSFWVLGAKILFWFGAVIWGLDALYAAVGAAAGVLVLVGRLPSGRSGWVWAAQVVRVVDVVLSGLILAWVASRLGIW